MVRGRGAIGKCFCRKSYVMIMGLIPYKRGSRELPIPFHHVKT